MSEQPSSYFAQQPEANAVRMQAMPWQTEVIRQIERNLPARGPSVIVLRFDGAGRVYVHGDGGPPAVVRIRSV